MNMQPAKHLKYEINDPALLSLIEAAAEEGARRALSDLGLHDDQAGEDMREIRSLLESWRSAKRTAMNTVVKWITTVFLTVMATAAYIKIGGVK